MNETSEILQYQSPGEYDVQCTLSAINIDEVMKNNNLEDTMYYTMKMLNNILDIPHQDSTDTTVIKAKEDFRAVGIGVLNFHGFLANNGISYESLEAKDFARVFFAMFNYYSLKASNREVARYGKFKDFKDSTYADGTYFDKYINKEYYPVTDKVKKVFEDYNIDIPTKEDWVKLKELVMRDGLANAYRNCIQPTGSISYLSGATQSVMPITNKVETRVYKHFSAKVPMPNLNNKNFFLYKEAYYMDVFKYLDLMTVIQEHIDQGISTTIFMTDEITSDKWGEIILYAHKRGLKTLYYSKTKTVKNKIGYAEYEECISCT